MISSSTLRQLNSWLGSVVAFDYDVTGVGLIPIEGILTNFHQGISGAGRKNCYPSLRVSGRDFNFYQCKNLQLVTKMTADNASEIHDKYWGKYRNFKPSEYNNSSIKESFAGTGYSKIVEEYTSNSSNTWTAEDLYNKCISDRKGGPKVTLELAKEFLAAFPRNKNSSLEDAEDVFYTFVCRKYYGPKGRRSRITDK